uniref:Ceramide synthase 6 n=1 Tax=Pseudonaja textilis TaxID=8673 RepID=A0A670XVQ2_PSETE
QGAEAEPDKAKMAGILAWFWNERFWLPHNVTWADLKNTEEATYPQVEDLYLAFPLAFCIFMIRILFERFIAKPCALGLKVQANGPQKAQPNAILEKVFTAITKHPDEKRLEGLSKQLDWDVRSIQRWFRQRRNQEKPRILFLLFVSIFPYSSLDGREVSSSQPLMPEIHYYYILELAFYWSLMFSQFIDIKRKDFSIMFTHHIVAVLLLIISYVVNFTRLGTLACCLHDVVDFVLEAAKMANYCKFQKLCDFLFLSFAIIFIITRLGIYPLWILNTVFFELPEIVGGFPGLSIFIILLSILQILHCFWSYLIIKAAYKAILKGKTKDDRSDVESSSDEETSTLQSRTSHSSATINGTNGTNGYLTGSNSAEEY